MTESCGCGCGKPKAGRSAYASSACRTRAWKRRVAYGPQKPLQGRSNGNVPPKRSGLQLSYRRAVREVAIEIATLQGWAPTGDRAMYYAERAIYRALSDRQRERLDSRRVAP